MKTSIFCNIIFLIMAFFNSTSNGQNLDDHKWNNRILIIKTLDRNSEKFNEQLNEFKNSNPEFKERKLVLYRIENDEFSFISFTDSVSDNSRKLGKRMSKILDKSKDFEVILIGLDGGIKLRQNELLLKEELFKIIDSMPMRRNEMKN